jgi:diphthamide biosynthesis protein 3
MRCVLVLSFTHSYSLVALLFQDKRVYHYPCPCGDRFEISREQLKAYEDIATCPSCSLVIRVVYDPVSLVVILAQ